MPVAAAASRKRKQTEDMEESPPKRITRARSAKVATDSNKGPKTTKITTGSAQVAAAARLAPKANRLASKLNIDTETEDSSADELIKLDTPAPVKRGRGRPKKVDQATSNPEMTTTRPAKSIASSRATQATATTKARARKGPVSGTNNEGSEEQRTRSSTTKSTRATSSRVAATEKIPAAVKQTASRKKVTFDDEATNDKENLPANQHKKAATSNSSTTRSSAVMRRATASTSASREAHTAKASSNRTTRAKSSAKSSTTSKGRATPPLSPKKVMQLAKSAGSSSEDELCNKSSVRAMSKSPRKAPPIVHNTGRAVSTTDHQRLPTPSPPSKGFESSMLRSPAKRPPPSPFKEAIKKSPLKFDAPNVQSTESAALGQAPLQHSLQASPRKLNLNISASNTSPQNSPLKISTLKSPAKRPCSPEKARLFPTSSKSLGSACIPHNEGQGEIDILKLPTITPKRLFINPDVDSEVIPSSYDQASAPPVSLEMSPSPTRVSPAKVAYVQYKANPLDAYKQELVQAGKVPVNGSPRYRTKSVEADSDDDRHISPSKSTGAETPTFIFKTPNGLVHRRETLGITPLALKMSAWNASSPDHMQIPGDAFSAVGEQHQIDTNAAETTINDDNHSGVLDQSGFFEEEMVVRAESLLAPHVTDTSEIEYSHAGSETRASPSQDIPINETEIIETVHPIGDVIDPILGEGENVTASLTPSSKAPLLDSGLSDAMEIDNPPQNETSQDSCYGDENAIPIDPMLMGDFGHSITATDEVPNSALLSTPKPSNQRQREVHTVSKVPLRMEGPDVSPIRVSRKRSKSIHAPLGELPDLARPASAQEHTVLCQAMEIMERQRETPNTSPRKVSYETSVINALMAPNTGSTSTNSSPVKSYRQGERTGVLRGAVVYVDVHTSEGADASSIFVELLTQMGARCVKQWTWNPRHSSVNATPRHRDGTPSGKVGITHVVFKDGGKRTLQKVREAKGLVLCVGVSWVLDCERENTWVDEAAYAVDTSTIPRGGQNRRKSMEPKMVSNQQGTLVPTEAPSGSAYEVSSPTNEFRAFSAASRRSSIRILPEEEPEPQQAPSTPSPRILDESEECDLASWASPTTPYYLSKGAMLVQQTCPPKTLGQPLFPVSGRIEDQPDEGLRHRLMMARRKSLQWAPKIKSPLGRAVSYNSRG